MRFTLLGPLGVQDDSGPRAIGARKAQLLLALLLLEANRPVSAERIKLVLWGEQPPSTVSASLYNHVAQLRRALAEPGRAGVERISRQGQAYALRVEPGELDTEEFTEQVRRARQAHLAGDWPETVRHSGAALALWRGEPLAELAEALDAAGWLSTYAQARLQALEWRFDAELALGHHQGLIPELTALTGEHPLHEPFHRQLMLALHRSGRQGDAIAVHQQLLRTLDRELGVTPGADVQAAHREILAEPVRAVAARAGGPSQLPQPGAGFVGREDELAKVRAHLAAAADEPAVVVVSGMPGVGKSALAARLGRHLAADFPDGRLYLNLRGSTGGPVPVAPAEALGRLLTALGVETVPADPDAAGALLRSTLAGSRTLIVLDDAGSAGQVRPLLPGTDGCAVVVTSRSPLAALDCTLRLPLGPLPEAEAVALLARVVGAERVTAEPGAARRVLDLCGRLPLALRVVAARLVADPLLILAALGDQLADESERLDHLAYDDLSVRRSLGLAHRALTGSADPVDQRAALALRRLAVLALVEYEAAVVARLLDCPAGEAAAALAALAEVALLDEVRPGRYGLHDLVRDFSRELGQREDTPADRDAAQLRALRWYADQAGGTAVLIQPAGTGRGRVRDEAAADAAFADPAAALEWYDQEVQNLGVLIEQQIQARHPLAPVLVRSLGPVMQYRGHWSTLGKLNELVLGAARETGDRRAEAFARHDGAGTLFIAGDFEAALARTESALELWRELGDLTFELAASNNRGTLLEFLGRYAEAAAVIEGVLELDQGADDYTRAVAWNNLGNLYEHADPLKAIEAHQRCIELARRVAVPGFLCASHSNIGHAYLRLGRPGEALPHFEEAMRLARQEGTDWLAECTAGLGFVQSLRELGLHKRSVRECQLLVEVTEAHGDTYHEGLARHRYGLALRDAGRPPAAAVAQWRLALRALESTDNAAVVSELRELLAAAGG